MATGQIYNKKENNNNINDEALNNKYKENKVKIVILIPLEFFLKIIPWNLLHFFYILKILINILKILNKFYIILINFFI